MAVVSRELTQGREAYARRAWAAARDALAAADRAAPLAADDLELLATAAYMLGRDDDYVAALERAHHAHLADGLVPRAARCAFWLGMNLALRGQLARASGWLRRARRLVERERRECVERGYLLLAAMFQHEAAGEWEAAYEAGREAAAIGERFDDGDLLALVLHAQGRDLVRLGRVDEGLGLLDEAMVAVTAGEVSPIVTGLVYCSVIEGCEEVYALRRAREWTAALAQWCGEQPELVSFTGKCLVHRAAIMQIHGDWDEALEEARQATTRTGTSAAAAADAIYRQGEVHRLRGDLAAAEKAYRDAARRGREPQPGLALVRLAQGRARDAGSAIERVLSETPDRLARARLLPAAVEIALGIGDIDAARRASGELEEIAATYEGPMLGAMAAHARGAVDLAAGDARAAVAALRTAWRTWQELEAPYEAARARELVAVACRSLGDGDAAALELEAARAELARLGAKPDLARIDALERQRARPGAGGLTQRELQVLRLVAAGATNKRIAAELVLSERTIDRHVSNIFRKLGVSSRAAATAYAYEHDLL